MSSARGRDPARTSRFDPEGFDHHDAAFISAPELMLDELVEHHPVARSERYGGFWLISRYADVCRAAIDYHDFTSAVPGMTVIPPLHVRDYPHIPLELDPPEHTRYRKLVAAVFERRRVEALRPALHELAGQLIEGLVTSGGGDAIASFCVPMSVGTLARFMGLPVSDAPLWAEWVQRMFDGSVGDPTDQRRAVTEYEAYLDALIVDRRRVRQDDFISLLLNAEDDDGLRLTDDEIRGFGVAMLLAGHETTQSGMGMALLHLALHPDERARIWREPELIPAAVNELLRLHPPIQIFLRNAAHDLELHGCRIAAGDVVAVNFAAANRDPLEFADPGSCVLDRRPNRHVTFGFGHHLCLGIHVARMEMQIMLAEVRERMPDYRLDPTDAPEWKPRGDTRGLRRLPLLLR